MNAKKVCLIFNKELQAKGNSHNHLLIEQMNCRVDCIK